MAAGTRLVGAALVALVTAGALVACEATPDLSFGDGGSSTDATVGADASAPDANGGADAGPPVDSAAPDAGTTDATDGEDAHDANPAGDANTCGLGEDAPSGAGCCGASSCIGPACSHCPACLKAACVGLGEWCCAVENPAGKYTSMQCSGDPEDASVCPLTAK